MAKKIKLLVHALQEAGFQAITPEKESYRAFAHRSYLGVVSLYGKLTDDTKPYQEKQVREAITRAQSTVEADHYLKWVEWSAEDRVYIGKCPDLITGIHGDDPVVLYAELCAIVEATIQHFTAEGRALPPPCVRPVREVA